MEGPKRCPAPRQIAAAAWDQHRLTIERLYIDEGLTLAKVMKLMEFQGFKRSKGQYIRQLEKWNISKKLSTTQWKCISRTIKARSHLGKQSQVTIRAKVVPLEKVRKETNRHDLPSYFCRSPSPCNMDGIQVSTPPAAVDLISDDITIARYDLITSPSISPSADLSFHPSIVVPDNLPYYQFLDILKSNSTSESCPGRT